MLARCTRAHPGPSQGTSQMMGISGQMLNSPAWAQKAAFSTPLSCTATPRAFWWSHSARVKQSAWDLSSKQF